MIAASCTGTADCKSSARQEPFDTGIAGHCASDFGPFFDLEAFFSPQMRVLFRGLVTQNGLVVVARAARWVQSETSALSGACNKLKCLPHALCPRLEEE